MDPEMRLTPGEARLLGVLVEKALTTPEQYPLSLNAATLGANQKSNRDPVLSMSEDEASEALDGLIDKQLARKVFPGRAASTSTPIPGPPTLKVEIGQLALLAELLMRGPQTTAELRARASRMLPIDSLAHLDSLLEPARGARPGRAPPGRTRQSGGAPRPAALPGTPPDRRTGARRGPRRRRAGGGACPDPRRTERPHRSAGVFGRAPRTAAPRRWRRSSGEPIE